MIVFLFGSDVPLQLEELICVLLEQLRFCFLRTDAIVILVLVFKHGGVFPQQKLASAFPQVFWADLRVPTIPCQG